MSETESTPIRHELKLDLDQPFELVKIGIRRATAFLKIVDGIGREAIPEDLSLGGSIALSFWPRPITENIRDAIHREFHAWVVGSCLKELEQHFAIFLDGVWRIVELSELHGKTIHSSAIIRFDDKFPNVTNSARKAEKLSELLGAKIEFKSLDSLSRARNVLTHGIGIVRKRDVNAENQSLAVSWRAWDLGIKDGDKELLFREFPADMYQITSPEGAQIFMKARLAEMKFEVGEKISFSQIDLAEICLFYHLQAASIIEALRGFLIAKGINPNSKPT